MAGLQRRIARTVAEQAGVALTPQVEARLASSQNVVPEAYEAYFRGRASVRKSFLRADIERALGYFEKAIALDPDFAPAYAEKGWAYGQLGMYCHLSPREAFPKQEEAARQALELDPLLAEGHAELGYAAMVGNWDWSGAEECFKQALELNPNSPRSHFYYANFLSLVCRHEEAIAMQRRLLGLDPFNPESHWNMGWNLFWAQRYDESLTVINKMRETAPEDHWLEMALGVIYAVKGQPEPALAMCEKARAGVPIGVDCQFDCFTTIIYARAGEKDKARSILRQIERTSKLRLFDSASIAGCHVALGDMDDAAAWLEKALRERSPGLVYLKVAPFWRPLLADPRGRRILRGMNFPG
ncbi:MAG: hypothetical protein A2W03_16290 [Candidatus Aminicenantes bacterium RBG_16_63_16]|nr:MAG: hypothetical protein A2W03_16290 [Candidatus Aminicenantes bacterium RBG_16_63_16]